MPLASAAFKGKTSEMGLLVNSDREESCHTWCHDLAHKCEYLEKQEKWLTNMWKSGHTRKIFQKADGEASEGAEGSKWRTVRTDPGITGQQRDRLPRSSQPNKPHY